MAKRRYRSTKPQEARDFTLYSNAVEGDGELSFHLHLCQAVPCSSAPVFIKHLLWTVGAASKLDEAVQFAEGSESPDANPS